MAQEPKEIVVEENLAELIGRRDVEGCSEWLSGHQGVDAVRLLARLSDGQREELLGMLAPAAAAEVIETIPEPQAVGAIEALDPGVAARILEVLPSDEQADLIGELPQEEAEAILDEFDVAEAAEVRFLASYEDDEAGGVMVTEFLSYPRSATVAEVLEDLGDNAEQYANYDIQYAYVTDEMGRLQGVLPLRSLLLSPRLRPLYKLMTPSVKRVLGTTSIDDLAALFRDSPFVGLPVVDDDEHLIGVVRRGRLEHALAEEADETYRATQGIVGGEELRSMPLLLRSRRRLAWLSVNVLLNVLAASVIASHQGTLEAVIALAVFLPIISDMSGCSGNQAVAVSMRELTLGVVRPGDVMRVFGKELSVGLINGLVLGLLVGGAALAWKSNAYLGLVVAAALALNTLIAVGLGGTIPLVLKKLDLDPALASGPILTTVTDMCGFALVLGFASAWLERLTVL